MRGRKGEPEREPGHEAMKVCVVLSDLPVFYDDVYRVP